MKLTCVFLPLILAACHFELFKPHTDPFYSTILATDASNPAALYAQGKLLLNQGRYSQAEDYFDRLVKIEPGNGSAWDALGRARLEQARFSEAQKAFEHELTIRTSSDGQLGLAEALLMQGHSDRARQLASENENQFGPSWSLSRLYGDIAYRNQSYPEAIKYYEESLVKNPEQRGLANRLKDLKDYLGK